ncbi:PRC-barrel domain-containing protein [Modicisalibacter ilicicola DSM 19980]|uniref:PRC-barrel domain-containing protein n=1 Tax=Modicisalibacter ilicicola DSM 19980 TaxID=1121942 RepID=A0A1M4U7K0_9GAMM|nr:PRC-barrel domain-containing protein [Halomonas ilicicola]SHE52685.1 PRC-barrel domain-containing protein [Halomonas ilicicola DSM 19980]
MTLRTPLNHAICTALVAGGLAFGGSALAQPQGLYSADELTDAEVYTNQSSDVVGEVEDVLLDENMQVHSLVIDTSEFLDFGQKQHVVETGKFTVETVNGKDKDDVEYKVTVDMTEEQIAQQPEYTDDWWAETKKQAANAWQETKQTAESAWQSTKAATASALSSAGEALDEAGNETEQAAENAAQETEQAADEAANETQQATEAAGNQAEQAGEEIDQETNN